MKRISLIITTILLVGCLFLSTEILSKSLWNRDMPHKNTPFGITVGYHPDILNTFNNLFPIYSYEKAVCRKPLGIKYAPISLFSEKEYHFKGFSYQTQPIGNHYLHIQGNATYQNGNTFLLVPHSYLIPSQPVFRTETPKVLLSGSKD